jgi:hypothetical protein
MKIKSCANANDWHRQTFALTKCPTLLPWTTKSDEHDVCTRLDDGLGICALFGRSGSSKWWRTRARNAQPWQPLSQLYRQLLQDSVAAAVEVHAQASICRSLTHVQHERWPIHPLCESRTVKQIQSPANWLTVRRNDIECIQLDAELRITRSNRHAMD